MTGSSGGHPDQHRKGERASGSAVLPTQSEGMVIELSHFEGDNATPKGDYLWLVVVIVIGGVPTVLAVRYMCLFMTLGRILLQCSLSTNLFDPMRDQVDLQTVELGI